MPSEDTQFKRKANSYCAKPLCTKFLPEHDAWLRAHPDRAAFMREAVVRAIEEQQDGRSEREHAPDGTFAKCDGSVANGERDAGEGLGGNE